MKFKGKSFIAIVLSPELPFADWFGEIDRIIARTPGFFIDRPIVLDVRGSKIPIGDLEHLLEELGQRSIRVMGIDGVAGTRLKPGMPPTVAGQRPDAGTDRPMRKPRLAANGGQTRRNRENETRSHRTGKDAYPTGRTLQAGPACIDNGASIVITEPVRSGQSILHPDGDVTVIGSVSSGAEIIAGGSIHVYGALRGRALAGVSGKDCARIFCSKFEAELVSINGLYKVADDFDATLRNAPAQIRFENETLVFEQLN
ncbi:UNVERIFIED_CONTAM: hypothetical protein GTU68_016440 [Idotea baltica]|nr:hypothetical protein [Idotea baltica]